MTPEQLKSWQPDATTEQLSEFIQQNSTLFTLLEEMWQKYAATLPQPATESVSHYAEGMSVEDLAHFPITHAEMMAFLSHFEKEREHNDRPFGNYVEIREQSWSIEEL